MLEALSTNKVQVCGCKYSGSTGYKLTIYSEHDGVQHSSISFFFKPETKQQARKYPKDMPKSDIWGRLF